MGKQILNNSKTLIDQQFEELVQTFPNLRLCEDRPGQWVIRGELSFSASFQDGIITDTFSVMIVLPDNYPNSPPVAQETGGRISPDFHQYPDRTLCLGIPIEVKQRFRKEPTLMAFVERLLIPYLYSYSYFEKYGKLPFGEFAHGGKGIREYYQYLFKTNDIYIVLELLKIMVDGSYRGHHLCPCNSGEILRKCHGPLILKLIKEYPKEIFFKDLLYILISLENKERDYIMQEKKFTMPIDLQRELNEIARTKNKHEKYK